MATSERSSASRHSSDASGHVHSSQATAIDPNRSRAVIHILEVEPRRTPTTRLLVQPRTTQTTQKDCLSGHGDDGRHGGSHRRDTRWFGTRRAAVLSVLSVLSVVRVVSGTCCPWHVLSVARCIRGPCSSVAQSGEHALTHCPPCVHPDRRPHSRGAQRPEQGTGTAAGLRKVRDAPAAAAGRTLAGRQVAGLRHQPLESRQRAACRRRGVRHAEGRRVRLAGNVFGRLAVGWPTRSVSRRHRKRSCASRRSRFSASSARCAWPRAT